MVCAVFLLHACHPGYSVSVNSLDACVVACGLPISVATPSTPVHSLGKPPSQPTPALCSSYVPGWVSAAFVTCSNDKVTKEIARAMVEKQLAWMGNIKGDSELLMMIKTQSSLIPALTDFVHSVLPYEVAEVISLPMEPGNSPYLHGVHQVTESVSVSSTEAFSTFSNDAGNIVGPLPV
uniref:Uncharacterized protein n=1 Tax=Spermophilus dauricus TaxID=99837 RepID=A0A8C9PDU5_SPEDA